MKITDIFDILIVAFIIYRALQFMQKTRAEQLVKGLILLLVMTKVSEWLRLNTIHFILVNIITVGVLVLVVIFQPEIRKALEYLGRGRLFKSKTFVEIKRNQVEGQVNALVKAVETLVKTGTGALIVIERKIHLNDAIETGTLLRAKISKELLINIFNVGAPLHDGAVILREKEIYAAGCVLPLSTNISLSSDLGTRHRAAVGVTENSDAIALVVSEETKYISIAEQGGLRRNISLEAMKEILQGIYIEDREEETDSKVTTIFKQFSKKNK